MRARDVLEVFEGVEGGQGVVGDHGAADVDPTQVGAVGTLRTARAV